MIANRFMHFSAATLLAAAFTASPLAAQSAEDLRLTVGKSVVIDYPSDIRQISTSDPLVVDASPVTTREVLLNGKGLGTATMVVWNKEGQRTFYNISVDVNLDPLRRLLRETFPNESIEARTSKESISLNGTVSTKEVADRAGVLAGTFAKTVVNNLQLGTGGIEKQILLRVKFAELDRSKASEYGVNILGLGALNTVGSVSTGQFGTPRADIEEGRIKYSVTDVLNIAAIRPDLNLAAYVKALQSEDILQILAEPNLVTANGKEANFLVGGEFPVPVLQGGANSGAVTIQFREFGIRLWFTPQMTVNNTIKMFVKQEVSALDYANSVQIAGFTVPAISTRRAETNVEMGENQTFVIAGLIDNRETELFRQIPVIGNIPILGSLFKSKKESKSTNELIMMVTPEITEPLGPADPRPAPAFPNQFLQRLDPKDIAALKQNTKETKTKGGTSRNSRKK
jgi:pilus assembly protein CpaC